jgi:sugar phosphate isomerase/epimerase
MQLMICLNGAPEQLASLPEIAALGAGIELGSYGLAGVRSEQAWAERLALHQALRDQFTGPLALHGPFLGMDFCHVDCLIRSAVQRRMDMTFAAACQLRASRVVLHSGYVLENDIFHLRQTWLEQNVAYWQREITRWARAGIEIVIENDIESEPGLLVELANGVGSPALGLCLDVGHQHVFSRVSMLDWVQQMAPYLRHIHLHDNDGKDDQHAALGRGTIDFESLYTALEQYTPDATISLEVEDRLEVKLASLCTLVMRFRRGLQ